MSGGLLVRTGRWGVYSRLVPRSNKMSVDEFILMFDSVFAPNKLFGGQLRAAAGRGEVECVHLCV